MKNPLSRGPQAFKGQAGLKEPRLPGVPSACQGWGQQPRALPRGGRRRRLLGLQHRTQGSPWMLTTAPRRAAFETGGSSALVLSIAKCCLLALKEKEAKKKKSKPQPPRRALIVLSLKNSSAPPAQRIISEHWLLLELSFLTVLESKLRA